TAATSSRDTWAVGYSGNVGDDADKSLIEHWNGTAWSTVASPNPYTVQDLYGVAADSSTDAWAVGRYFSYSPYGYGALIEHWNGSSWKTVPDAAPYPQTSNLLFGVEALSATKVWAAGTANGVSFVEKWNGAQWSRVSSPNVGTSNNTFQATAAIAGDVWAVGEWYQAVSPYQARTLVEECAQC